MRKNAIKILINQFSTFGEAHVRIEAIITVINCSITNDEHKVVFVRDYHLCCFFRCCCCCFRSSASNNFFTRACTLGHTHSLIRPVLYTLITQFEQVCVTKCNANKNNSGQMNRAFLRFGDKSHLSVSVLDRAHTGQIGNASMIFVCHFCQ